VQHRILWFALFALAIVAQEALSAQSDADPATVLPLAPLAIAPLGEGELAVLGSTGRRLVIFQSHTGAICRTIRLPGVGSDMVVDGRTAYVTTGEPAGRLLRIDLDTAAIAQAWRVGHWPTAPVLSADHRTLWLANRFENRIRAVDLATGAQRSVGVVREPVAMVLGPGGKHLFVANHLPEVRPFLDDENPVIVAEVSVIDAERMQLVRTIELPNGSQGLRGMALSPDGRYVAVTHIMSNYTIPTMEVAGGAMNRNALSLIRTDRLDRFATVLLDDPQRGDANPWGVCFSGDRRLIVAHAGTHELSVIDFAALVQRADARRGSDDLFDNASLTMMTGIRTRIELPVAGPRAVRETGGIIFAAGYFSDDLAAVDMRAEPPTVRKIDLEQRSTPSLARLGEQYFNDATLCHQHWQSCATCHPDGRADALYWDLLNDGIGNTKNTKSLRMAPLTPPVMWRGVRADAGMAVDAGIRHIQFAEPPPEKARAIEAYLRTMKIVPSPALNADVLEAPKTDDPSCAKCHNPGVPRGTLSNGAQRGKRLFEGKAGCSACHPHPYFTTMRTVDPGLGTGVCYDVPSLVEAWRSAPYLHHGDGLSLEETITDFNHLQRRGATDRLTRPELDDLIEYVRSL